MSNLILAFFKNFLIKWLSTTVLEQIVILCIEKLVKCTKSDFDDALFETVFKRTIKYKTEENKKEGQ